MRISFRQALHRPIRRCALALLLAGLGLLDSPAAGPLQIDEAAVNHNPHFLSGSVPSVNGQTATPFQFGGATVYSASPKTRTHHAHQITAPPAAPQGTIVMGNAIVGLPFLGRTVDFQYGSEIPPPATDENDVLLGVAPTEYWEAQPINTNAATFYWSPHKGAVFATQPGPIEIVWKGRTPFAAGSVPSDTNKVFEVGGNFFPRFAKQYVIGASPVKVPRQIFWTSPDNVGEPVNIPGQRISEVHIEYNSSVPEHVSQEEAAALFSANSTNTLNETRTLWLEQHGSLNQLHALNREGRVFVELLGDLVSGGPNRQHLGFEIVEIIRDPLPHDIVINLGERLTAWQDGRDDSYLQPSVLDQSAGQTFVYRQNVVGSDQILLYATRTTLNQNDVLVNWLEAGVEGIRWPLRFTRYRLVWPDDPAAYSHYLRPPADTEEIAVLTSVAMPGNNVPVISYQDPLDLPRAKLTADNRFYTWLVPNHPAHRTLLRFTAGEFVRFERVFSWLGEDVAINQDRIDGGSTASRFNGSVAAELNVWNGGTLNWTNDLTSPRVISEAVSVGQRITAPANELGAGQGDEYWAGFINYKTNQARPRGDAFSWTAYVDPLTKGFEAANQSSIIPVNAIPGDNRIEVWWFRRNSVNTTEGFEPVYWPSVIGRYTVQWPTSPLEIILASNHGSGPLPSLPAKGAIYQQNTNSLPGFNPNEEHALVRAGQAFALRDDLNISSNTNNEYSSDPFVLLEYAEADGRPAMQVYQVLREKGDIRFDYAVTAGLVLQPPMPLPLLQKPLVQRTALPSISLNKEVEANLIASNTSSGRLVTTDTHFFTAHSRLVLQDTNNTPIVTRWYYATNVDFTAKSIDGVVSTNRPALLLPDLSQAAHATDYRYLTTEASGLSANDSVLVGSRIAAAYWNVTVVSADASSVTVRFTGSIPDAAKLSDNQPVLVIPASGVSANDFAEWRLSSEGVPTGFTDVLLRERYASFTFQDRKGDLWVYRGRHHEADDPVLGIQYYYKTLDGFFFPSLSVDQQPDVGTITPYLRPRETDGSFNDSLFDPVHGDADRNAVGDENSLPIRYRPVWPTDTPVLQMAETLTFPKRGLPAVRGQISTEILYQQSQVLLAAETNRSAVLHDPTREKTHLLGTTVGGHTLNAIPSSVKTQVYLGNTFFPNLPPHLADRFFMDPNRGANGGLVFRGQFFDEAVGEDYILVNVLGERDRETLKALTIVGDADKAAWDAAIDALSTTMETFEELATQPGTYAANTNLSVVVGPASLAEVTNDDVAVDSYALTASGPGTGYITLINGNGLAFTPIADPVSIEIIRVVKDLHRGEIKIVQSSNPLGEKVSFQQAVDLAGETTGYAFQWKIAPPVDGVPPAVFQKERFIFIDADSVWHHIRFPVATDTPGGVHLTPTTRSAEEVRGNVQAVSEVPFLAVTTNDVNLEFTPREWHFLVGGEQLVVTDPDGTNVNATVVSTEGIGGKIVVTPDWTAADNPPNFDVRQLGERAVTNLPQSIVYRNFSVFNADKFTDLWLSLDLDDFLGAKVYFNGALVATANLSSGNTATTTAPGNVPALSKAYQLTSAHLASGIDNGNGTTTHWVAVELFSQARPGARQTFDLRLDAFHSVDLTAVPGSQWLDLAPEKFADGLRAILGESADVQSLADNYVIMRYQATNSTHASFVDDGNGNNTAWSLWTEPQLAEGWIKRVLAGINPFNQRVTDLFSNQVNTDASMLTLAGPRWEGNIALNLETINQFGLIEIYETVLRRGRGLSIDAGIDYGPANDALLLAAGYLNDLYMFVGNEAWADAANPTIGIGTADETYGDIATSLFAFRGQVASLLDEELGLLRGRDDFAQPGVETAPAYHRMYWNYTRGINSGEVIYALNYDIHEDQGQNLDGSISAADAQRMFPQGHGDAYGHYLTALKGYYSLLIDTDFTWVPRVEAVTVLGKPVQVDYQDERKFATAAAALARAGRQIFDLTWRKDFKHGDDIGWEHFSTNRVNVNRAGVVTTRYWGVDHWAARTGQGAFLNWVVGNAILPAQDTDPTHEGIQVVDRTTVPELPEIALTLNGLQTVMDNAEGHLNPLGFSDGSLILDLRASGAAEDSSGFANGTTSHFEQVFERAKITLQNAVIAFDDAKDVTRRMRSDGDSLNEFQAQVDEQELAYKHQLIELYGTPYADDIGPGKTYVQGYDGPDFWHFMYVDNVAPQLEVSGFNEPRNNQTFTIDIQNYPGNTNDYFATDKRTFAFAAKAPPITFYNQANGTFSNDYIENTHFVSYTLNSHGFFQKPATWTGRRASPGRLQTAISDVILAHNAVRQAINVEANQKYMLDRMIEVYENLSDTHDTVHNANVAKEALQTATDVVVTANGIFEIVTDTTTDIVDSSNVAVKDAIPRSLIVGVSSGGDLTSVARGAIEEAGYVITETLDAVAAARKIAVLLLEAANEKAARAIDLNDISTAEWHQQQRESVFDIDMAFGDVQHSILTIHQAIQELDEAQRNYLALVAEGNRIQAEREVFRKRAAVVIQGARTRDAAFRIFRDEKLERYKTLFDLAAQYTFLTAQTYDYETGLLGTDAGRAFIERVINSRALGVVQDGDPQFAGSNTGDPGLSSILAEMHADWQVVEGRLGFNNPDVYRTTVSLRAENYRILANTNGHNNWKNILEGGRKIDLLQDADVRRYCMQIDQGEGLPVPGIVLEFSTTIAPGLNLFGRPLAGGDHAFDVSSFANKIFSVGVALEGYQGMDDPTSNSSTVDYGGANSPSDPSTTFLGSDTLAATPYVYLIPVGVDSMRVPPLGDATGVRSWKVDDVTIPLPFNIGASDFSSPARFQSADTLSEDLFSIRKHQAFRPVSTASLFAADNGSLFPSTYSNTRLIGRSVWNSKWKLVIAGRSLLADPEEGLDRLIRTVRDIKLNFETYSYSGN